MPRSKLVFSLKLAFIFRSIVSLQPEVMKDSGCPPSSVTHYSMGKSLGVYATIEYSVGKSLGVYATIEYSVG